MRLIGYGAAMALLALACLFPTERGDRLQVEFVERTPTVLIGRTLQSRVRVVLAGTDEVVDGVLVAFRSSDPTVVAVDEAGTLRGVGAGSAEITAYVPQFEDALPATHAIQVLYALGERVESFAPDTVAFGEVLTVVGRFMRQDSLARIFIGTRDAPVHSVVPSADGSHDTLRLWVPVAPPESPAVIQWRGGETAVLGLTILQRDVLEPNDAGQVTLTAPFTNPALALEQPYTGGNPSPFDVRSMDWYRLAPPASGEVTMRFTADATQSGAPELLVGTAADMIPTRHLLGRCNGLQFGAPVAASGGSVPVRTGPSVIALRGVTDTLHLFALDTGADTAVTQYGLEILDGYVSDLPPDAFEENDLCHLASTLAPNDTVAANFDTPADFDWFRVNLPAGAHFVTATIASDDTVFMAPTLLLYADSSGRTGLLEPPAAALAQQGIASGDAGIQAVVTGGSYLLLAANFEGAPSDYELQVAAVPLSLVFEDEPAATTEAGALLGPLVRVAARFPDGSLADAFNLDVTLSIASGTGTSGATLRGTLTQTAVDGITTFPDLSIDSTGTGYVLEATAAFRPLGTSGTFDIVPAPPHHLEVSPGGLGLTGVGSTRTFETVAVVDSLGNRIADVAAGWTSLNPDVATVDGGGTVTAVARGQTPVRVEFNGLEGYGVVTTQVADADPVTMFGQVHVPTDAQLNAVWGSAPDNVWAVGDGGVILHWDGTAWTDWPSPATHDLLALWGAGATDVWAVGAAGGAVHFDGAAWQAHAMDPWGPYGVVWGSDPVNAWAAIAGKPEISKWDGQAWHPHAPPDSALQVYAVGGGARDVWAPVLTTDHFEVFEYPAVGFFRLGADGAWHHAFRWPCTEGVSCPVSLEFHALGPDTLVILAPAEAVGWLDVYWRDATTGTGWSGTTWARPGGPAGTALWVTHLTMNGPDAEMYLGGTDVLDVFTGGNVYAEANGRWDQHSSILPVDLSVNDIWGMAPYDVWFAATGVMLRGYRGATLTPPASSITMTVGDTLRLVPDARDAGGAPLTGILYAWSDDGSAAANIDSDGLVTALAPGTAVFTARTLPTTEDTPVPWDQVVTFTVVVQ